MTEERIQDDLGYWWAFDPTRRRIYCEAAEQELGPDENGYFAKSFTDGVQFLKDEGYITEAVKP
jgi:hypothetical protein